ncbi:meiotic nuclear division protein 1 homolog [Aplysia californica]|uniref:Meiotic nuclear division protein 1 homolog n=1 Tax=Aplysia californica TaxID=6500 RepID=A0ABM1AEM0_APLCA|nr:meiotic nuclear division protein 1 homolog [Aplysia californica]
MSKKKGLSFEEKRSRMVDLFFEKDEREEVMEELTKRRAEREVLTRELEKYRESDPEVLHKVRGQTSEAREAANRWTGQSCLSLPHRQVSLVFPCHTV